MKGRPLRGGDVHLFERLIVQVRASMKGRPLRGGDLLYQANEAVVGSEPR